ncbi:MAG: hypothetical protein ACUVXA_17290 [Candidatus Jordarchaeum sp.]|uniref:hypothetical protein n=1 Tax=Candidatus Jordarchaeum sp. TaxID=2823881 RepID=UPI004049490B
MIHPRHSTDAKRVQRYEGFEAVSIRFITPLACRKYILPNFTAAFTHLSIVGAGNHALRYVSCCFVLNS